MKVRNKNYPLGTVSKGGKVYHGDAHGVFDVPQDFGNWLCGTPGWEPVSGASLGNIVGRPEGMSEEAHAKAVVSAEAEKRKQLEAQAKAEAARAKKAAEEDQRADDAEPQSLDGTNAAPPAPPPPPAPVIEEPTKEAPQVGEAGDEPQVGEVGEDEPQVEAGDEPQVEGPVLEGKTKDELLEIAEEWSAKGYEIDVNKSMNKGPIKKAIETALYGGKE